MLEQLGVEGRAILPGPVPRRIRASNALHNRVRYLQKKTRKLEGIVEEYKNSTPELLRPSGSRRPVSVIRGAARAQCSLGVRISRGLGAGRRW